MTSTQTLDSAALYAGPPTFMELPFRTDATGAKAAILGCPFDCGTHAFRVGARQGPAAIRAQSGLLRRYDAEQGDCDMLEEMGAIDAGDVIVTPSRCEESFAAIEEAAYRLGSAGAVPVGFGGDGSISLPLVRAAGRLHPGMVVLHIDSHSDAYPVDAAHKYDAATQFTHAAQEQRVLASNSWHVGLRGTARRHNSNEYTQSLGYNIMTMREFQSEGSAAAMARITESLKGRPVYLSWDMDVFDPSCAPGVCTPVWGGFSAREGLEVLRSLEGLNIVGADVNTVSPAQDINGMTAFLAATVTHEILTLIWRAKRPQT